MIWGSLQATDGSSATVSAPQLPQPLPPPSTAQPTGAVSHLSPLGLQQIGLITQLRLFPVHLDRSPSGGDTSANFPKPKLPPTRRLGLELRSQTTSLDSSETMSLVYSTFLYLLFFVDAELLLLRYLRLLLCRKEKNKHIEMISQEQQESVACFYFEGSRTSRLCYLSAL